MSSKHKGPESNNSFPTNSNWKRLTPVEIEINIIPCNFNSKGDTLRQEAFQFEFQAVWWVGAGLWLKNDVVLLIDISTRRLWSAECRCVVQSEFWLKLLISKLRTITPLLMSAKQLMYYLFCKAIRLTKWHNKHFNATIYIRPSIQNQKMYIFVVPGYIFIWDKKLYW